MEQGWYQNLSGSTLKIIAMVCMLTDHIGATVIYRMLLYGTHDAQGYAELVRVYEILRGIGRTAFPVFCFLLVEGFYHTRSRMRYVAQMCLFALLSELPFDLAFSGQVDWGTQNVYFTLAIGLLVIWSARRLQESAAPGNVLLPAVLRAAVLFSGCAIAYIISSDYDFKGVLLIYIFYLFRNNRKAAGIAGYLSFLWEPLCFPAFLMIQCYNGERGLRLKYLFYLFYPLHLTFLYVIMRLT